MAIILIVDDNPTIIRLLSHTLRKQGHEVIEAVNGREALELLAESQIALGILDIAMPEMDGLSLLRHLRQDARWHSTPFIMLTASGQDEDREVAEKAGANAFLTKPTSSRELLATVDRLLEAE
jgi:CheY-like chemotaxis protein